MTKIDFLQYLGKQVQSQLVKPKQSIIQSYDDPNVKQKSFLENIIGPPRTDSTSRFTDNLMDSLIESITQGIQLEHIAQVQNSMGNNQTSVPIQINDDLLTEQQIINICNHLHSSFDFNKLYDWQRDLLKGTFYHQCLLKNNILIQAGTASGKTYIVQLYILRCLFQFKKSVIFVVPFVTLVDELTIVFKEILNATCSLCCLSGMKQLPQYLCLRPTLYLCTIEKANLLIREIVKQNLLEKLGLIVCDEIHIAAEANSERASKYELLISELLLIQERYSYKIISMSATISNVDDFKGWLKADLVTSDYRPVSLKNYIVLNNQIAPIVEGQPLLFQSINQQVQFQTNSTMLIAIQAIKPLIIFCPTRVRTRQIASELVALIKVHFNQKQDYFKQQQRQLLANQLSSKIGEILFGVCYHNASLPQSDRQLIENAYREGILHTLVATTTVAVGVNLPAVSIIISSTKIGNQDLDNNRYKQMIGRAGRVQSIKQGYSYLIYDNPAVPPQSFVDSFMQPQPNFSQLMLEDNANNSVNSLLMFCYQFNINDFNMVLQRTLYYEQNPRSQSSFRQNVEFLLKLNILEQFPNGSLRLSKVGLAVGDSGLSAVQGFVFNQLLNRIAAHGFQICNNAQIILLCSFNFNYFSEEIQQNGVLELSRLLNIEKELGQIEYMDLLNMDPHVLDYMEIQQEYLESVCALTKGSNQLKFYICRTAIKVERAIKQYSEHQISQEAEELVKDTASQAGQLSLFCKMMQLDSLSLLFKQFQQQLRDLLLDDLGNLLEIRYVGQMRARLLKQSGFHCSEDIIRNGYEKFKLLVQFGDMSDAAARQVYDGAVQFLEKSQHL